MRRKILILLLIGLGLILPFSQVKAFEPISAAVFLAINSVLGWALQAVSFATAGLVGAASAVLHWVLYSLPFKYTSGGIVAIGWPIVRDLVNMLFVIILVFIGLAVALRLREYEAKKTLVWFVVIALLINFTPVIIGLIVDASNIVMNFFLKDLNPGAYWEAHWGIQKAAMPSGIFEFFNPVKQVEHTLAISMIIVMDLLIFAVLSMYALLFLTRYLAIWVLVILSPIAFACYILPATRKYWSQWWNQLLQWCIIGIVGAFFLYLGTHMFEWLSDLRLAKEGVSWGVEISGKLIPLMMIIIFYVIGLMTAFSTSAMGAKQITAGFKRGYKAAGKTAAFRTWGGFVATHKAIAERPSGTYKWLREKGMGRREALAETTRRSLLSLRQQVWPKRRMGVKARIERIARGTGITGASRGVLRAVRDVAKAGALAGFGIRIAKKKKGEPCPQCKKRLPSNADYCSYCGFKF